MWKSRRHLLRIFKTIRRRRESRTKLWRLIFTKFTKLQRRSNKTPFLFYFNWLITVCKMMGEVGLIEWVFANLKAKVNLDKFFFKSETSDFSG